MATRERLRLEAQRPTASPSPAGSVRPAPRAPSRASPSPLGLPLTMLHVARLEELQRLVGRRYQGWGLEYERSWFVDVLEADAEPELLRRDGSGDGVTRHRGDTLHHAISAALAAAKGHP